MPQTFKSWKHFVSWNERMFQKHTSDRCWTHPNPLLRWIEQRRLKALLKFTRVLPHDRVLEVGCGSGHIMNKIKNGKLYGIDLSKTAITDAKKKTKGKKNIKHLSVQPAEKTSFAENFFDVVYCSEVIEHVEDPKKILDEVYRVAKPGSRVVFTFPNEGLINFAKQIVKNLGLYSTILPGIPEHMEDEWHVTEFNKKLFRKFAREKFRIKSMKAIPLFFAPLRYAALMVPKK